LKKAGSQGDWSLQYESFIHEDQLLNAANMNNGFLEQKIKITGLAPQSAYLIRLDVEIAYLNISAESSKVLSSVVLNVTTLESNNFSLFL
jgi:hypothetical protein